MCEHIRIIARLSTAIRQTVRPITLQKLSTILKPLNLFTMQQRTRLVLIGWKRSSFQGDNTTEDCPWTNYS